MANCCNRGCAERRGAVTLRRKRTVIIQRFDLSAAEAGILSGQTPESGLRFGVNFGGQYQAAAFIFAQFQQRPGNKIASDGGECGPERTAAAGAEPALPAFGRVK